MALAWDDLGLHYDPDDDARWWAALSAEPPSGSGPGILERVAGCRPRWQTRAACRGLDTGRFFPTRGEPTGDAKRVCAVCPVRAPCAQWAADNDERFGIWGGVDTDGRRRLLKKR